jgi:phosphohistidine phosphatase
MRRLLLLRHAKSDRPAGVDDHERPLASRGRLDSARMGRVMAAHCLRPDLAIVSTARRTRETWELARPAFGAQIVQQDESRIYDASAAAILDVVHEADSSLHTLLLVGHNPGLHSLILELIGTAEKSGLARLQQKFPTAGLVVIDFDIDLWTQASMGGGRLERFETPKSAGSGD